MTRLATESGWAGAWVSEVNGFDAVTQAAALAPVVGAGRIGTAIVPMQTRDPLLMAMSAASLNQLLPGRLVLGLGTSTPIIIQDWHAADWGKPIALTREYVAILRQLLAGDRVTHDGARYRLRGASLGNRLAAPIPLYLAALNDRMLELAGEIADGVILNFASLDYLAHARARLAAGAARAGRSPADIEVIVFFRCSIVTDYALVRDRYQRELLTYVLAPVYQKMFAREGFGPMCTEVERLWKAGERDSALAAVTDTFTRGRLLAGTTTEIGASLDSYFEAGMDSAIIMPIPTPGDDYTDAATGIVRDLGGRISARAPVAEAAR